MASSQIPWVEDVVAPEVEHGGHLDNVEIARMLYDAWSRYLDTVVDDDHPTRPTVRSITVRYDREVHTGERLRCGVTCTGRSRRAFTLEQTLWRPGSQLDSPGDVLAVGTVVLVAVDPGTGRPMSIPASLWSEIEAAEGRTIAPT